MEMPLVPSFREGLMQECTGERPQIKSKFVFRGLTKKGFKKLEVADFGVASAVHGTSAPSNAVWESTAPTTALYRGLGPGSRRRPR